MNEAAAVDTAVAASKAVVVLDHLRNNRIEYIGLAIIAHLMGWMDVVIANAPAVCG